MNLFSSGKDRTALCFDKVTLKQDREGNKSAKLRFAVRLEPDAVRQSPKWIQAAYELVETRDNCASYVELEKDIRGVNVDLYSLPEAKSPAMSFQGVELTKLAVERSDKRSAPHLLFTIEVSLEEHTRLKHWIVDAVFSQLWAQFQAAQTSFIPTSEWEASAGVAEAVADMASVVDGKGITSMSMEIPGKPDSKVTITAEDAKNMRENAKRIRKEARPN